MFAKRFQMAEYDSKSDVQALHLTTRTHTSKKFNPSPAPNKNRYRIVLNKARNLMIAIAENTASKGKGQ